MDRDIQQWLTQAAASAQAQHFETAIVHYQNILEAVAATGKAQASEPLCFHVQYQLGLLRIKTGDLPAAKQAFLEVIHGFPAQQQAHFYLGLLALHAEALEEAESYFLKVLTLDKEQVQSLVNLGVIALKRKQDQEAIQYFTQALALDNNCLEARNNLAATFLHHDRYENALVHYQVLLKAEPKDPEYLYNAAVAEMELGKTAEASRKLQRLLNQQPEHFAALTNLAAIAQREGNKLLAIQLLEQAAVANPQDPSCRFMLTALKDPSSETEHCPDYAKHLFDRYAINYDKHLSEKLQYRIPKRLEQLLQELAPKRGDIALDLGCGTGLCAEVLRPYCRQLIGVDIASKMLAQARRKGIYDQLIEAEILEFLQRDDRGFELILCADVLPYFGDLSTLFTVVRQRLLANGLFIFTVEASRDKPWQLQETLRFSHQSEYIRGLAAEQDFSLVFEETVDLRQQNNQSIPGLLFALR